MIHDQGLLNHVDYSLAWDAGSLPSRGGWGGVAGLVGIEGGVVSGLSNPNDSGVATPVETTPCEAITRSLSRYILKLRRAPNFFTTGFDPIETGRPRSSAELY
jgi:hypothetical protein